MPNVLGGYVDACHQRQKLSTVRFCGSFVFFEIIHYNNKIFHFVLISLYCFKNETIHNVCHNPVVISQKYFKLQSNPEENHQPQEQQQVSNKMNV